MAEVQNLVRIRVDSIVMDKATGRVLSRDPIVDRELEGTAVVMKADVPEADGGDVTVATGNISGSISTPWAVILRSDRPVRINPNNAIDADANQIVATDLVVLNLDADSEAPDSQLDSLVLANDAAADDGANDATVEVVSIGNFA